MQANVFLVPVGPAGVGTTVPTLNNITPGASPAITFNPPASGQGGFTGSADADGNVTFKCVAGTPVSSQADCSITWPGMATIACTVIAIPAASAQFGAPVTTFG